MRHAIRRLMRVGSVLDPLAEAVFHAREKNHLISSMTELLVAVSQDEEMKRTDLVDPPDAFVALAEAYDEEVGPVESELIQMLGQVTEIKTWPPGLVPMVAQYVGRGGRSEREWDNVKSNFMYSSGWGENWEWLWSRGVLSSYDCKDHGWKTMMIHKRFHPLALVGVWASGVNEFNDRYIHDTFDPVKQNVTRHPELIKTLAILFYLLWHILGVPNVIRLMAFQSHYIHVMQPEHLIPIGKSVMKKFRERWYLAHPL